MTSRFEQKQLNRSSQRKQKVLFESSSQPLLPSVQIPLSYRDVIPTLHAEADRDSEDFHTRSLPPRSTRTAPARVGPQISQISTDSERSGGLRPPLNLWKSVRSVDPSAPRANDMGRRAVAVSWCPSGSRCICRLERGVSFFWIDSYCVHPAPSPAPADVAVQGAECVTFSGSGWRPLRAAGASRRKRLSPPSNVRYHLTETNTTRAEKTGIGG